jgi:hypothetical protein
VPGGPRAGREVHHELYHLGLQGALHIKFGLQIGAYRRIELKRIAHHFAPVLRLEPGILVDETEVVEGALKGTLLRLWLGRRARGHWRVHGGGLVIPLAVGPDHFRTNLGGQCRR